jgi:hypothetical protein
MCARLRQATSDLSWLLSRGYALPSSLKIVGDRYGLHARQRLAVARCACSDQARQRRRQKRASADELRDGELWIDGFNVLTSIEAALSGGLILRARDGCYRDLASMHGSYRRVHETAPALERIGETLADCHVGSCAWYLDQPVSNSGRLKAMMRDLARGRGWDWTVHLVSNPDGVLARATVTIASSDSQILDRTRRWFPLAGRVIDSCLADAWIVDLG